jgi:phosphoribosylformylglycinamidine synthase subunit PurQ / glutaminase
MKAGVIIFPGSNCDRDCLHAASQVMRWPTQACWHRDPLPPGLDLVIVPGGFSYGDYLRTGAIAALSPVMDDVRRFAAGGGLVMGICNGFQILCEAGLLPGALRINRDLLFHCEDVALRVEQPDTAFTTECPERIVLPIAHREGNYAADAATLERLEGERRVIFRYEQDVNGAANRIAGIINGGGNVLGMMPHPERASEAVLGSTHGLGIFRSLAAAMRREVVA